MLVLGIDTSTPIGSVGLIEDANPLAELALNVEVTHSERLLESIDFILRHSRKKIEDIDLFAWAKGPGSFTGLRIGLSTVKGVAFSLGKKMTGVSSLKTLAMNVYDSKSQICVMMDARKSEIYTALYESKDGKLKVLEKEKTISLEQALKGIKRKTIFLGSGARLYKDKIKKKLGKLALIAAPKLDMSRGVNVSLLGLENFKRGRLDDMESVLPNYLRKSQAEVNFRS